MRFSSIAVALAAMAGAVAPAQAGQDETRLWVDQFYADYLGGELTFQEMLDVYYAEDVDFDDPTFGIDVVGHEALTAAFGSVATENSSFQNIGWEIEQVFGEGDKVNVIGRWSGSWFECPFDVGFSTLFIRKDGKITRQLDFFGVFEFERQVKLDEAKGIPTCETSTAPQG